jgi:hypothetical protein
VRTKDAGWLGSARQTTQAKAPRPMLPIAEPVASKLTDSAARRLFFCLSCFSISVALAGKIAGNAKNRPPMTGPSAFAIIPAIAVTKPPNRNRTAYSYHLVSEKAERLNWTFMELAQTQVPEAEGRTQPNGG